MSAYSQAKAQADAALYRKYSRPFTNRLNGGAMRPRIKPRIKLSRRGHWHAGFPTSEVPAMSLAEVSAYRVLKEQADIFAFRRNITEGR